MTCLTVLPLKAIAERQINELGLFLSPNLCLLSQKESQCEIKLHVRWQTQSPGHYCIKVSDENQVLQCWKNTKNAQTEVELKLKNNLSVSLIEQESEQKIYQQTVRLQRQVVKYRRKRRNPWQFY
ncbi:DUF3019 domain-containing protein [Aliikangiella coralliicola]|uniref:DUF3019 domain-containing protein n=1 Tax=Aliikangiella coralliicola TaxID=2592383 RepID=A0A545UBQ6_9GAMM|nr:DUF3019 domain-containing protein [Aliikangiella coralliicola]TQV86899.1 DUF3019 domain-containing protein [Aliikangiella coralliicola]